MANFNRPTVIELKATFKGFLEARLGGAVSILRRSTIDVFAAVLAQAMNDNYAWLESLIKQCTPAGATGLILSAWAVVYGITRKAASFALGDVVFVGDDGTAIPEGTEIQNAAGERFRTLVAGSISSGQAVIQVRAVDPGTAGNTEPNAPMSLVDPVNGVDSVTASGDGLTGGTENETDAALRTRLLFRIQNTPRGGANHDYIIWATSRAGVTHAWVVNEYQGPGSVGVAIINDQAGNFYPGAPIINDVQTYLGVYPNQPGVAPVTAEVLVFAPTPEAFDFTIALSPRSAAIEAAVIAELDDTFVRNRQPGISIPMSHFNEAVSLAEGEFDHEIVSPLAVNPQLERIAVLGNVTFQDL